MPSIKVTLDDSGFDKILSDMQYLESQTIEYGYPEDIQHTEAETNLPSIVLWNERGTKTSDGQWHIPPRPFVSDAAVENMFDMVKYTQRVSAELGRGRKMIDVGLNFVGNQLADSIRQAITDQNYQALAPSTVAGKGHDTMLIETSFMFDHATYKITRGGL